MRRWWPRTERLAYRKTYRLKPGQSWFDAETTEKQWEHYVQTDGGPMPIGAKIAQELKAGGATFAAFTEMWGGFVVIDDALQCVELPVEVGPVFREIKSANGGSFIGLPDAFACFADGRIAFREAKVAKGDRLQPQQHKMADIIRSVLGIRADLAVVEWN